MFVDQTANGIWGLHGDGADSVLQALFEGGAIGEPAFSLCYEPVDPRSKSSLRSGFFVVGGVDATHHVHEMQFAELKVTGAFYAVETLSVSLVGAQGDESMVEAPAPPAQVVDRSATVTSAVAAPGFSPVSTVESSEDVPPPSSLACIIHRCRSAAFVAVAPTRPKNTIATP